MSDGTPGWRPGLVALDIDGTLLKWIEGAGQTYEVIPDAVYDAVHRAYDAGAHIVLASGRSPHGMTRIADLFGLPRDGEDREAAGAQRCPDERDEAPAFSHVPGLCRPAAADRSSTRVGRDPSRPRAVRARR